MGMNQGRAWPLPAAASHAEALFAWPAADRSLDALLLEARAGQAGGEAWSAPAPRVSVIVRTKNRPGLLRQAILSVSAQTYRDIELVVVNDGGEEVGKQVDECVGGGIRRVVYESLGAGRGRAAAANVGLALATGKYLIFLDDDDWFLPEHIANLAAALEGEEGYVAAYGNTACVSWQDGQWRTVSEYRDGFDPVRLAYENYLPIHSVLFRKSALDASCRFEESLDVYEDWGFWLLLSRKGPFLHLDRPGAMYRIGGTSGVGLPGTGRDYAGEYQRFIAWAKAHWTGEQAVALARGSISLKGMEVLYAEAKGQLEEERRAGAQLAARLAADSEAARAALEASQAALREQHGTFTVKLEQEKRLCDSLVQELDATQAALKTAEDLIASIYQSKSWRYTAFLRAAVRLAWHVANLGGFKPVLAGWLKERLGLFGGRAKEAEPVSQEAPPRSNEVAIICTPHTFYVAMLLERELAGLGFAVSIATEEPARYADCLHIVICPQMLKKLPGRYVAFQMEQSVSPRWFTDQYLDILEHSVAILDYSLANVAFLQRKGLSYRQIYYLPLGPHPDFISALQARGLPLGRPPEKKYDVLFYGDCHIPRRREALAFLSSRFAVKVIGNTFGAELYREILAAKVVLNIHYYEDALLETTRIYECLSLGVPVVSEQSSDQDEHAGLDGIVTFVDCGDFEAMAQAVESLLADPGGRAQALEAALPSLPNRFGFFFRRFLLAHDLIDFDLFYRHDDTPFVIGGAPVCLSLPETTERRARFAQKNRHGFSVFDGLRHQQGWIGCAMSYKYLILRAKAEGLPKVLLCEDDVELPADYEDSIVTVNEYLDVHSGEWNIFAGIISNIHPDTNIYAIAKYKGMEFVHINKIVSMVFNIYHHSIYDAIIAWDPSNRDVDSNTVDRFIEGKVGLRIVTTLPYFVGHEEACQSTLWGFENTQYIALIAESESRLRTKAGYFKAMEKKSKSCKSAP